MRMLKQPWKKTVPFCVFALFICLAAPVGAASHPRTSAWLDEPFEINGQLYAAGLLAVRELGPYNPSSALVEISVNRTTVGVLLARASDSANPTQEGSTLLFTRSSRGHLTLIGFTDLHGDRQEFYTFRIDSNGGRWLPPAEADMTDTLLASR